MSANIMDLIQEQLPLVEIRMRSISIDHNKELESAIDHLLSSGGKRIRPTVTLLSGGMLDSDEQKLITLAAAIEMLHTATLVHDDLIDGALLRRGISTLNARWSPAATVLTGDFMFARAAKLAAETENVQIIQQFADTLATIVNGEIDQMFPKDGKPSIDDYEKRIFAKTASLFELATRAAGLLSPVDSGVVDDLARFGYDIGMAFQIIDDVLDFTSEQSTVGKPVASDLRQGIITLPAIYFIEEKPDDMDMNHILSGNHYEERVMDRLVASICESGAVERSLMKAQDFIENSLTFLSGMPDNAQRDALEQLAKYVVDRNI
jgi:geranylgeranyl pyrophosphate synthase